MDIKFIIAAVCVALALLYAFSNGFHDSGNIIASMISSRAMTPNAALFLACIFEFAGAYFLGSKVAMSMAYSIVNPLNFPGVYAGIVLAAALVAAIVWNVATWRVGMPSSSSHTLIGSIFGAFAYGFGIRSLEMSSIIPIIIIMFAAPIVCFFLTYAASGIFFFFGRWFKPGINKLINMAQIASSAGMALSSGSNDAQKAVGVIVFALAALGYSGKPDATIIPVWVVTSCAVFLSAGILFGGFRVAKTMGMRLCKIRPAQGFTAQTSSFLVLTASNLLGFPVSATQVAASSIMGAGATGGFKRVRWNVFISIAYTWAVTMPAAFVLGYVFCFFLSFVRMG